MTIYECERCHKQEELETSRNNAPQGWQTIEMSALDRDYRWICPDCYALYEKEINVIYKENEKRIKDYKIDFLKN